MSGYGSVTLNIRMYDDDGCETYEQYTFTIKNYNAGDETPSNIHINGYLEDWASISNTFYDIALYYDSAEESSIKWSVTGDDGSDQTDRWSLDNSTYGYPILLTCYEPKKYTGGFTIEVNLSDSDGCTQTLQLKSNYENYKG